MYDGGVKLYIPLEGSCRACRSRCCTWPSLAYPALAQAQCSGHREGQPATHTHLRENNHSQDGCWQMGYMRSQLCFLPSHAELCGSMQSVFADQQFMNHRHASAPQSTLLCVTWLQSLRLHLLMQCRDRACL